MPMPSLEELKARYTRTETERDDFGRVFTVGLLKPSQRVRLIEMCDNVTGYSYLPMLRAASVRKMVNAEGIEIGFAFPQNRRDLDIALDTFDAEGQAAIERALTKLAPAATDANGEPESELDASKN